MNPSHLVHVRVCFDHLAQEILRALVGHLGRREQAPTTLHRLQRIVVEANLTMVATKERAR